MGYFKGYLFWLLCMFFDVVFASHHNYDEKYEGIEEMLSDVSEQRNDIKELANCCREARDELLNNVYNNTPNRLNVNGSDNNASDRDISPYIFSSPIAYFLVGVVSTSIVCYCLTLLYVEYSVSCEYDVNYNLTSDRLALLVKEEYKRLNSKIDELDRALNVVERKGFFKRVINTEGIILMLLWVVFVFCLYLLWKRL